MVSRVVLSGELSSSQWLLGFFSVLSRVVLSGKWSSSQW